MSRVRIGELSQEMVEEVTRAFQADVAESYTVFALSRTDFEKAAEFLLQGNTGLRVGMHCIWALPTITKPKIYFHSIGC